jgi:hypothetical protein
MVPQFKCSRYTRRLGLEPPCRHGLPANSAPRFNRAWGETFPSFASSRRSSDVDRNADPYDL